MHFAARYLDLQLLTMALAYSESKWATLVVARNKEGKTALEVAIESASDPVKRAAALQLAKSFSENDEPVDPDEPDRLVQRLRELNEHAEQELARLRANQQDEASLQKRMIDPLRLVVESAWTAGFYYLSSYKHYFLPIFACGFSILSRAFLRKSVRPELGYLLAPFWLFGVDNIVSNFFKAGIWVALMWILLKGSVKWVTARGKGRPFTVDWADWLSGFVPSWVSGVAEGMRQYGEHRW